MSKESFLSFISKEIDSGGKVIISGLDGTGKSTLISELYPKYYVFKSDAQTSDFYFAKSSDEVLTNHFLPNYQVIDYINHYQLFDRHPLVDFIVYTAVDIITLGDINTLNTYMSELIIDGLNLGFFDNYSSIILFLGKIYNKEQHPWLIKNEDTIRIAFAVYQDVINNIFGCELCKILKDNYEFK